MPLYTFDDNFDKPRYIDPCNDCGLCCHLSLCNLGKILYDDRPAPCPALYTFDGLKGYKCHVVDSPQRYAPPSAIANHGIEAVRDAAKALIGSGLGCETISALEPPPKPSYTKKLQILTDPDIQEKARAIWESGDK